MGQAGHRERDQWMETGGNGEGAPLFQVIRCIAVFWLSSQQVPNSKSSSFLSRLKRKTS